MTFFEQFCSHCPHRFESEAPMGCVDCPFLEAEDDEEEWGPCEEEKQGWSCSRYIRCVYGGGSADN